MSPAPTLNINILQVICGIIQEDMGLAADQVFLWNQKWDSPSDARPYVSIRVLRKKPFGVSNPGRSNLVGYEENPSANFQATLSVDIFSRGLIARDFGDGVLLAFSGDAARKAQEKYGFYIAPLASEIVDISDVDGAAIPYRFNFTVNIQYFVLKQKQVDYYDVFVTPTITREA